MKHWAHFDIAGVMDNSTNAVPYVNKGMSGIYIFSLQKVRCTGLYSLVVCVKSPHYLARSGFDTNNS